MKAICANGGRAGQLAFGSFASISRTLRSTLLVPVIAVFLLTAAPAAADPVVGPETGTIVTVELQLEASNGLHAQLETSDDETVTLELRRKGRLVSYEVQGEVTEAGLKVRFGRLGLIDVAFTPTRTLNTTEPSEGCTGAPRTLREGVFAGTIDFTGERGYVRIAGSQTEGSMSVVSQWQCPDGALPLAQGTSRLAGPGSGGEGETASLHASGLSCGCFFSAGIHHRKKGGRSVFLGARGERREGMEIVSETIAYAGASAFVFDHARGTATVRPPPPFSGQATFEDRPHGRDLWRGNIRVPMLGVEPFSPHGPVFQVGLYPEYHFD